MLKTATIAHLLLFTLAASVPIARNASAQTGPGVYRSYTLVKVDLTVNEPVLIKFSIENRRPDALKAPVGSDNHGCCGFRARITRPDGRTEEAAPKAPIDGGGVALASRKIEPFGTYRTTLLANKWFGFDIPGRYVLYLDNTSLFVDITAPKLPFPTDGQIVIDVGPRDPGRLEQICTDLENRVMNTTSAADALEAEDVLTHITDPVAVPHIARVLEARETMTPSLVDALARIADNAAVDALILRLHGPWKDQDTPLSVRGALDEIYKKTDDPIVKLKIEASRR